jgi:outer membrane protein, heavy metal efflux system
VRKIPCLSCLPFLVAVAVAPPASADVHDLDQETRLEAVLALALARNPDLAEDRARIASARTRATQAGRLPDLQLKYEQWGVPIQRPLRVDESNALMLGISQTFPAPGTREVRERLAQQDAVTAAASASSRRRELRAQVRRAFADYYRADRELGLHREHIELTTRLVELARASYRSGKTGQQDVLRLSLELSRLHRDVAHIQQERISAQALLNALMNRPGDAPLGAPAEIQPPSRPPSLPATGNLDSQRAELAAAQAAVRRSEAASELARKERRWPSVTLGLDYMYMPFMEDTHAYGAMVMMNLPWLSASKRDAMKAAEESLAADRHALESVRNVVAYEIRDSVARANAARSTFNILDTDLLPQAQRNFEAAQSAYAAGQGEAFGLIDSLRSYLELRLDRVRALVHLETAAADLERATGEKEKSQ